MLAGITETHNIEKDGDRAVVRSDDGIKELDPKSPVSMNMWGPDSGVYKHPGLRI